jgi:hypothetical protein
MPVLNIYTDPLKPGICQVPVFSVGDDQNWSFKFNNGNIFYNPTGVTVNFGYVKGLIDGTYASAFEWWDRMNNRHIASFSITGAVPSALTWDETPIGVSGVDGAYLVNGRTPNPTQIRKVYVTFAGTGVAANSVYLRATGGGINTPTGHGAAATATVAAGGVNNITVTNSGDHYSNAPVVALVGGDGTGARATTTLGTTTSSDKVISVTVTTNGTGYTVAPSVVFLDPEATLTPSFGAATSVITGMVLKTGGQGYITAPAVGFVGGGGSSAAVTAVLAATSWPISALTITNQGSGYTSAPTVGFTSGGGSGAAAVATVNLPDSVQSLTQGSSALGRGYLPSQDNAPLVFSGGGGGSGATGYIHLIFISGGGPDTYGAQAILTSGGTGYTVAPSVALPAPGGTGGVQATATPVLGDGKLSSLTITNPGTGYTGAPTVGFTGGGGINAAATATLVGSPVASLTITNAGTGYTSAPVVTFTSASGSGASAIATISALSMTGVTVTNAGWGYTSAPSIDVFPPSDVLFAVSGFETNPVPFLRNRTPISLIPAVTATPYTSGRMDSTGALVYDNSIIIIRPKVLLSPTLTIQADGLTWAGVFTPVVPFVNAVLNYRRSVSVDIEVFGGGRLLYTGALTIAAA